MEDKQFNIYKKAQKIMQSYVQQNLKNRVNSNQLLFCLLRFKFNFNTSVVMGMQGQTLAFSFLFHIRLLF